MRYLYSFLFYLILPVVLLRLWWRSRRLPAYRLRIAERFGFYPFKLDQCIWVHTVSVGETIAATPMIKAMMATYSHIPFLITTMTPTGAARVQATFGDAVHHVYIPYDLPDIVARFFNAMNPVVGVMMETEMWPNLYAAARARAIPLCLVNARLSAKSARGYQRVGSLTREMLQSLRFIAANGEADAKRFIALGADPEKVHVTGNVKFDLTVPESLAAQRADLRAFLSERFIWIAASTHPGEEEQILAAHQLVRKANPDALLILVPRHPDRFEEVNKLVEAQFTMARRSLPSAYTHQTAVFLGDTMGELLLFYAVADVAFVAGSLVPRGGHNILEPAVLGKPILSGPHVFNFAEICDLFTAANALSTVADASALAAEIIRLMQQVDEQVAMQQRGAAVVAANRGALARQLGLIAGVVSLVS